MREASVLTTILCAAILLAGCRRSELPGLGPPEVTVMNPLEAEVADYIDLTGTVGATASVDIVARVEGYLEQIYFQDGSYVKKGTPLFKIQQDEYLDQLQIDQAQLDYATAEYNRQLVMIKQNATSQANVQKYLSDMQQAQGEVALAKLNLAYTTLNAPFDGLLGEHKIDAGNLVGYNPGDPTKLVTIEQIDPIYVNFSINTSDALRLRKLMQEMGVDPKSPVGKAPIYAQLEDETGFPHKGVLDFSNNSVDTSTGTIQLRGVFKNENYTLIPGLFAEVRIPLGRPKPRLVVPETATLSDQQGDYVLVVNAKGVAERRSIVKGPLDGTNRAIDKGLTKEDRVIINGIANVSIGQPVTVTNPAAAGTK